MGKILYGIAECNKGDFKTTGNRLYGIWANMLRRCYCKKTQIKSKTYIGCTVDQRFLKFQDFAAWASTQLGSDSDWELDKDLLITGNRIYGPDTCMFVPPELNRAIKHTRSKPNGLPIGVTYSLRPKPYRASVCINDSYEHLGHFGTAEEAHAAHLARKCEHMLLLAEKWRQKIPAKLYEAIVSNVRQWNTEPITDSSESLPPPAKTKWRKPKNV